MARTFNDTAASDLFSGSGDADGVDYSTSLRGVVADLAAGQAYKVMRIVPLGDSITYGVVANKINDTESGGYRKFLWESFEEAGVQVDFVGRQENGPAGFDDDHEGYRGWTIDQIEGLSDDLAALGSIDAIMVMAGTNDSANDSLARMKSDMTRLLQTLSTDNPQSTIFVAPPPPLHVGFYPQSRADKIDAFNDALPGLVAGLAANYPNLVFVDMRGLTTDDVSKMPDDGGAHPTLAGYEKIADYWFSALSSHLDLSDGAFGHERDTLVQIDDLVGSNFADHLAGNAAANRLEGGAGADHLTGRGGADRFVIGAGDGSDVVEDFSFAQGDLIEVHDYLAWSAIEQTAQGTLLSFSQHDKILLRGVSKADFRPEHVVFADAPPPPPPPPDVIRVEAEHMMISGAFAREANTLASNGEQLWISKAGLSGTAGVVFTGETGRYDLTIRYFDERDGKSSYELLVDGVKVDGWLASSTSGSPYADETTATDRHVSLDLEQGQTVSIRATAHDAEWARVDYIEFAPVDTGWEIY